MISPKLCIRCKGKLLCGLSKCPILEKHSFFKKADLLISGTSFSGSSPPSVFVSWKNYPKIEIAPLSPPLVEDTSMLDMPEKWYGLPQERIIEMRQQLIRPNKRVDASEASNPDYELASMQELAMSVEPVLVDVELAKKLSPTLSFDEGVAPMGPSGPLKEFSLQGNPSIPAKVDYVVSDVDLKASDALMLLYETGLPISKLYKLLSVGTLGVGKCRKLVPTRWSIVASQDTIGKALIEEIKFFQQLGEIQLFMDEYLGNRFFILLIPSAWAFENLEVWITGSVWHQGKDASEIHIIQDHELYGGRRTYASNVEGAYYAARLSVCEYLKKVKRQAAVLVFREITPEYQVPLGNWVIQESVKHALSKKPLTFSSLALALTFIERKLLTPFKAWKRESQLLDFMQNQKRLSDF